MVLSKINKRMRGRKGFTLVELLLVVAILAVLAFLAIPRIANTIQQARIRTCRSNELIIEEAVSRYHADEVTKGTTGLALWPNGANQAAVEAMLAKYMNKGAFPKCPFADANTYVITYTLGAGGTQAAIGLTAAQAADVIGFTVACSGTHPKAP